MNNLNNDDKNRFDIDDARDTLERIHNEINACDTKASIVLGIIGVIAGVCLNDSTVTTTYNYLIHNISTLKCKVFFLITCIIIFGIVFGVYRLLSVLYARLKNQNKKSCIFFGDIAKYKNSMSYKQSLMRKSKSDLMDDYINQIHMNSIICDKKYARYNQGLKIVGIFLTLLVIDIIVFMCVR